MTQNLKKGKTWPWERKCTLHEISKAKCQVMRGDRTEKIKKSKGGILPKYGTLAKKLDRQKEKHTAGREDTKGKGKNATNARRENLEIRS